MRVVASIVYIITCHHCKKLVISQGYAEDSDQSSPFQTRHRFLPPLARQEHKLSPRLPLHGNCQTSLPTLLRTSPHNWSPRVIPKQTGNALPDSGADICVTGIAFLQQLHEHSDNLIPSVVTPRAVNRTTMSPIGKLPLTVSLGARACTDDFYIYPNVTGTLLS